jgi:molecular chaperone IbpA
MHTLDLTPLFRSTVGFDHLSHMIDQAFKADERAPSYPPYNILKTGEEQYEITMAVAGFKESDITITVQDNQLSVTGSLQAKEADASQYLHKGVATRSFERKFSLADHVRVEDAVLADGLLTVKLQREIPEAAKPRTIAINGKQPLIEGKSSKKAA